MAEPFTIYKLTILNMLDKVDFPLTNTQISNFFLEQDYTDYFRVQQVISDLVDADLIHSESTHSNTQYTITPAGKETLEFFKDKISDAIEHDTMTFLEKNKLQLRNDNAILADYFKTPDHNLNLIDLTLSVRTRAQAEAICNTWKKQNEDVYAYLMDILLK